MKNKVPKRGEIWWVDLDPTKGSEIKKTRPCLVISRDEYNENANTVTIIPFSSGEARYPAWQVEVEKSSGLDAISHLLLPQIRVAAKERLRRRIGKITASHFSEIAEKLLFYLGFDGFLKNQSSGIAFVSNDPISPINIGSFRS